VLSKTNDHFALYGVGIDKVSGLYVSLPDEVQKAVDTRASMQITGTNYVQYQSGQAMREAAVNPSGGAAGVGVGLGAGMGMGYTMMDSMRAGGQQQAPGATPPQPQQVVLCPKCGATNAVGAKFCQGCGAKLVVETVPCPKCGAQVNVDAKFCPECGNSMKATKKCPKCGTESPAGAKFCGECGTTF
jgi:membrane protease subunit (stomatin/prohibitin family)